MTDRLNGFLFFKGEIFIHLGICHISPYRELGVHPARSPLILQVSPAGSKTSQTKPDVELVLQI